MDRDQYETKEWVARALPFAQQLLENAHSLDHVFYLGCGFHYGVCPDIEATIKQIEDLTTRYFDDQALWMHHIIAQVRLGSRAKWYAETIAWLGHKEIANHTKSIETLRLKLDALE